MPCFNEFSLGSKEDEGDHNILICEDDFYIKDIFYCNRMLEFAFRTLPHWDVIMLAHNTHDSKETPYVTEKGEKIIKIVHSATGSGYLIKKSYIFLILTVLLTLKKYFPKLFDFLIVLIGADYS